MRVLDPFNLISSYLSDPAYVGRPVDLYLITLADGVTKYYWSNYDKRISWGVNPDVYDPQGPLIKRSRLGVKNTVEVPELSISLFALDTDFVGGINIKQQIHNHYFDGATFQLSRIALLFTQATGLGGPSLLGAGTGTFGSYPGGFFTGKMSTAKLTATGADITVKAANVVFNQYVPKNAYQTQCMHTFCDAGCALVAATYTIVNTVGSSPTRAFIPWGSVPANPSHYTAGQVTITSGPAAGQIRTVKLASSTGLLLQSPLYNTPVAGNSFSVIEGCTKHKDDGSGQDCTARSNEQHFRGFPYVPPAETAF